MATFSTCQGRERDERPDELRDGVFFHARAITHVGASVCQRHVPKP
jgi:hypothetical protein